MKARDYQLLLLSGFAHNRKAFNIYAAELNEDCFTEPDLKQVYEQMLIGGRKFTMPEIAENVTGGEALVREVIHSYKRYGMSKEDLTEQEIRRYSRVVDKLGRVSQLKALLKTSMERLDSGKASIDEEEIVVETINRLSTIQHSRRYSVGPKPYDVYLAEFRKRIRDIQAGKTVARLPVGFKSFNRETGGGLPKPGLVIIGGLPGSGKTQLAWQMAIDVAKEIKKQGGKSVVVMNSVEMMGVELASRDILSVTGVDSTEFRLGKYNKDQTTMDDIKSLMEERKGLPLFIDESDFLTSSMISSRVSGLSARYENGTPLIVTDYAELIRDKGESQEQRVSSVFVNAKALSKRLDCTVILLSHISRSAEVSGTKVPSIRQLRYSSMAEQTADMIILIYNPFSYLDAGVKLTAHPQMKPIKGTSYLILGKHRDGSIGYIPMGWTPEFSRWSDLGPKTKMNHYQGD